MKFTLSVDKTLLCALKSLNESEMKTCAIVSSDGKILRTVTDGDIRRYLISGGFLTDKLSPG